MLARRACGTRAATNAALIEQHQHRLALDSGESDARGVRQTVDAVSIDDRTGNRGKDSVLKCIAHCANRRRLMLDVLRGDLAGFSESHDVCDIFRSGATSVFLTATRDEWCVLEPPACVEHADALRRMKLVAAEGEKTHRHVCEFYGDFSDRLHSVGVERRTLFTDDARDFINRENHAGLVVCPHDGDKRGLIGDGAFKLAQIDLSVAVDAEPGNCVPPLREALARLQRRAVLDAGGYDMLPVTIHPERGMDRRIRALRAAARENDLRRLAAKQRSDALPPRFNRSTHSFREPVCA